MLTTLAQSPGTKQTLDILILLGVLVVGALVLIGAGVFIYRRLARVVSDDSSSFSLSDLRRMHAQGELSDEEFERAKSALIAGGLAGLHARPKGRKNGSGAGLIADSGSPAETDNDAGRAADGPADSDGGDGGGDGGGGG